MRGVQIAILTIGDELLSGRIVNTNAAWLAQRLTEAGFLVCATDTVGDERVISGYGRRSVAEPTLRSPALRRLERPGGSNGSDRETCVNSPRPWN